MVETKVMAAKTRNEVSNHMFVGIGLCTSLV